MPSSPSIRAFARPTMLALVLLLALADGAFAAPAGTGRVSGTVTDATSGAPIADVCVDVLTPAGDLAGRGFTDASGIYTATGNLWPGTYVVRVNGCPNDRQPAYTTEYWRNAEGPVDATPVVVNADATTTGIDEDLVGGGSDATYYVAPDGRDTRRPACPGGTNGVPWKTIEHGMRCLDPGDTLVVRGGTYTERVLPVVVPGTRDRPIRVTAHPGERVLVRGLIRLEGADHWTLDGIDVTNDGKPYGPGEYLVKFRDGVGWQLLNAEVWDARSYAAVRVETADTRTSEPARWRIADNCIHTTRATHPPYQDHNIYVNTGVAAGAGLIERNLVFDAPNGQNIKIGNGGGPARGSANVTVRYNTLWGAVQNVLVSGDSHHTVIERNILGGLIRPAGKDWYPHVRGFDLRGHANRVANNVAAGSGLLFNDPGSSPGFHDGGGNRAGVRPRFDRTGSCGGFHPRNDAVKWLGRYGPLQTQGTMRQACPGGDVPRDVFTDDDRSVHEFAIDCMAWERHGIARGDGSGRYRPVGVVTRGQMAAFVGRLLETAGAVLPVDPRDHFRDDRGNPHELRVNQLAEIGVIGGVVAGRYAPDRAVTRDQMATFLVRAVEHVRGTSLPVGDDHFRDDRKTTHEANINRAATAGIASGVGDGKYAPSQAVRREQMATFLARALNGLS